MTDNQHKFEPTEEKQAAFRRALGSFGTGVTVVTVATDTGPLGFTANSFSSVSLKPPLIQWSVAHDASRHDPFAQAQSFCIHVLATDQVELARHFARNGDGFDRFDWYPGANGIPVLNGCTARFHCTTYAVHPAGDHSLIIGQVEEVVARSAPASGLIFARGEFGRFVTT